MNKRSFLVPVILLLSFWMGSCDKYGYPEGDLSLYRRNTGITGSIPGISTRFTPVKGHKIHARYRLTGNLPEGSVHLFHFQWVGPDGKAFFTKPETLNPGEHELVSAISADPGRRKPGRYTLNVYYFRELLASRHFEVLPPFDFPVITRENNLELTVKSHFDGEKPAGNTVVRMNRTYLVARYRAPVFRDSIRELWYKMEWRDSAGKVVSRKRFEGHSVDSILQSRISLASGRFAPGIYTCEVSLFDSLLDRRRFSLLPPYDLSLLKTRITLCRKYRKKQGTTEGVGEVFRLGEKNKVYACAKWNVPKHLDSIPWQVLMRWVDPDGKVFYTKKFSFPPTSRSRFITGSISIAPGKRKAGIYKVQVWAFNEPVGEKPFELLPPLPVHKVRAHITLYPEKNKPADTNVFRLGGKNKVRALIDLSQLETTGKENARVLIEWVSPGGKVFYKKEVSRLASGGKLRIKSAVSLSPQKRRPGIYRLRVYLSGNKVAERLFTVERPGADSTGK